MAADLDANLLEATKDGDTTAMAHLLRLGADPDAYAGSFKGTPLQWAVEANDMVAVALLLDHGAGVDTVQCEGMTALMMGAFDGQAIVTLLAAGADVNRVDRYGDTALHYACSHGQCNVAGMLLDGGARTEVRNHHGKRPIDEVRGCLLARCHARPMVTRRHA